jgi:hypothetical protein
MSETSPTDQPAPVQPATPMQRIFMDRAREQAARAREKPARRPMQMVMSVVFALVVVLTIGGAINAFLSAMQRTMRVMDEQEKAEEAKREEERRKAPIPAYVVPETQDDTK